MRDSLLPTPGQACTIDNSSAREDFFVNRQFFPDRAPGRVPDRDTPPLRRSVRRRGLRISLLAILVGCGLAGSLLTGTAAAQSTFYRWTDESGNSVFSDRPPERADIEYETVTTEVPSLSRRPAAPASASPPAAGPATTSPPRPAVSTRMDDTAAAPPVERDPAICEQASSNLEVLDSKPRIRVYGDDGELRYLTPEQIEEQKEASRRAIELHCEAG